MIFMTVGDYMRIPDNRKGINENGKRTFFLYSVGEDHPLIEGEHFNFVRIEDLPEVATEADIDSKFPDATKSYDEHGKLSRIKIQLWDTIVNYFRMGNSIHFARNLGVNF